MTDHKPCPCEFWCSTRLDIVLLTGHNENCVHSRDRLEKAEDMIRSLVRGIESWAAQEDGIPDSMWDDFCKAKAVLGEPVPNPEPEFDMGDHADRP